MIRNKLRLIVAVMYLSIAVVLAVSLRDEDINNTATNWNDLGTSFFYNNAIKEHIETLPEWEFQKIAGPSASEITAHKVSASAQSRERCLTWIKLFLKPEYTPSDIGEYLIPLQKWATHHYAMPQKRIIVNEDAFFVRYQINGNLIQIIEENGIVTFIVKELNDNPPVTSDKQIDFAVNFAQKLFNKIVLFNDKQYLHTHSNQVTTEGTWIVWPQKDKEGTSVITFLTDGKFARYVIGKKFTGGMAFPPPEYPHFTGTLPPLYPDRSP